MCRIIRDADKEIVSVLAPNGEPSQLFADIIVDVQDAEEALDVYKQANSEKKGLIEIFDMYPEIQEVLSDKMSPLVIYSRFLDSLFPKSVSRDIMVRRSFNPDFFKARDSQSGSKGPGIYWSPIGKDNPVYGDYKFYSVLNIQTPSPGNLTKDQMNDANNYRKYDGAIDHTEAVVRDKSQVELIGTNAHLQKLKTFIDNALDSNEEIKIEYLNLYRELQIPSWVETLMIDGRNFFSYLHENGYLNCE